MRKLAIVMPAFFNELRGGAEYHCYLLAMAAQRRGIEVHYVYPAHHPPPSTSGLVIHGLKPHRNPKRFGAARWFYHAEAQRVLDAIAPDVVYVRGGGAFAGIATRYARRKGAISIWSAASDSEVAPLSWAHYLRRPLDILEQAYMSYGIRHATHAIAQTRHQAESIQNKYGRNATLMPPAVPVATESCIKTAPPTVAWVANIKPLKRPELFIQLAETLAPTCGARFVMIGGLPQGDYGASMRVRLAASPVVYEGEQPQESVNRVLAGASLLVNTSTHEGFPNTLLQAWMRETVVVTLAVDPDDIMRRNRFGLRSGTMPGLIRDVGTLLDDPSRRAEMGRQARHYAETHHSEEQNLSALLGLVGC